MLLAAVDAVCVVQPDDCGDLAEEVKRYADRCDIWVRDVFDAGL